MIYNIDIRISRCGTLADVEKFITLKRIRIIFFAETHGILDESKIQEKIISKLKPACFLYELLEEISLISEKDFMEFLKKEDSERFSVISSFGDLKPTVRLARKYHLPLIGCDVKDMCRKNKNFLKEMNINEEGEIMLKRERRQVEIIKRSLMKYDGLVFVSLGAFHLREDSPIFKEIKSNYIRIIPLVDGTKLEGLGEDFNIGNAQKVTYVIEAK